MRPCAWLLPAREHGKSQQWACPARPSAPPPRRSLSRAAPRHGPRILTPVLLPTSSFPE